METLTHLELTQASEDRSKLDEDDVSIILEALQDSKVLSSVTISHGYLRFANVREAVGCLASVELLQVEDYDDECQFRVFASLPHNLRHLSFADNLHEIIFDELQASLTEDVITQYPLFKILTLTSLSTRDDQ